jgi:hypothetical protein
LGDDADEEDLEVQLDEEDAAAAEADARVELVRQEILDRAQLGSRVYPFTVDGERVQPRDVCGADVYRLLLVLSSADLPYREQGRAHEVEEVFDYIALAALKRFLGRDAVGLRFARTAREGDDELDTGAPDPYRRPTNFVEAIAWLRKWLRTGEGVRAASQSRRSEEDPQNHPNEIPHWEDDEHAPPPGGREPLSSYNDGGVDIVVWWRFKDGRRGFPVLLAQCTVQRAWERKVRDIDEALWRAWIDFDTVPPQRALVIPFADRRDHPLWADRSLSAGVQLDRVRLLELLDELECEELEALTDERCRQWTETELLAA